MQGPPHEAACCTGPTWRETHAVQRALAGLAQMVLSRPSSSGLATRTLMLRPLLRRASAHMQLPAFRSALLPCSLQQQARLSYWLKLPVLSPCAVAHVGHQAGHVRVSRRAWAHALAGPCGWARQCLCDRPHDGAFLRRAACGALAGAPHGGGDRHRQDSCGRPLDGHISGVSAHVGARGTAGCRRRTCSQQRE